MESDVIFMNQSAGLVLQVLVAVEAVVKRVKLLEDQMGIMETMDRVECLTIWLV